MRHKGGFMNLIIKNGRGFFDKKTINETEKIYLDTPYKKFQHVLRFKSGDDIKSIEVKNKTCEIPTLQEGELNTEILLYLDGVLLKKIPCDRIFVKSLNNELQVIPEIELLKDEVENLKGKINTFTNILKAICNKNTPVKYNLRLEQELRLGQCEACPFFNKDKNDCQGFGVCCFDLDPKTLTLLDPISKLPLAPDMVFSLKEKLKNMEGNNGNIN